MPVWLCVLRLQWEYFVTFALILFSPVFNTRCVYWEKNIFHFSINDWESITHDVCILYLYQNCNSLQDDWVSEMVKASILIFLHSHKFYLFSILHRFTSTKFGLKVRILLIIKWLKVSFRVDISKTLVHAVIPLDSVAQSLKN